MKKSEIEKELAKGENFRDAHSLQKVKPEDMKVGEVYADVSWLDYLTTLMRCYEIKDQEYMMAYVAGNKTFAGLSDSWAKEFHSFYTLPS